MDNKLPVPLMVGLVCLCALLSISHDASLGVVTANVVVVVPAANVVLANLSTSASVTVGSSVPLYATLDNRGYMEAGNITLNVSITGPAAFNSLYPVPSLSPRTSENITIQINGATPSAGTYTLNAFASYTTNSATAKSNTESAQFTVTQPSPGPGPSPGGGGGGPPPAPIATISGITITSIPIATSAIAGQGLTSQIGVQSTSSLPERVNFTVDQNFTSLLVLSTNSVYLQPGQTTIVTATFKTQATTRPGTYIIPVTISTAIINGPGPSQTEYLAFTVYSNLKNGLQVLGQTFLTNSLKTLSGVISIGNGGNSTIRNGTLTTMLPVIYAHNASQITAFGLPNNVTKGPNGYVITWNVNKMQPGQVLYAYYNVQNQSGVESVSYPQNIFSVPSYVPSSSVLRVVEISSPSLYVNSTGYVNASVFYTGTVQQQVSFYLAGPPQATIQNPVQSVNASPNQLLKRRFAVSVGNYTGTLLLYLYITSISANLTESIPVIVSAAPVTSTSTIAQESQTLANLQRATLALEGIAVLAIAFIALLTIVKLKGRRPKPSPETSRRLVELRKRIVGRSGE